MDKHKKMTIYDVIGAILDDISFYGEPEHREEAQEELKRRAKEVEDVIEEKGLAGAIKGGDLLEWDDIEKKLGINDDKNTNR